MKFMRTNAIILSLLALLLANLACSIPFGRQVAPAARNEAGKTLEGPRAPKAPPTPTPAPPPVTTSAVKTLESNLQQAATQVSETGKINVSITESQATSLVAQEMKSQTDLPISDPQIYFRDGQITFQAKASQSGITLPVKIVITVSVDSQGKPAYQIRSASLGVLTVPDSLLNQFKAELDSALANQLNLRESTVIETITIADGIMTVTGHTR